jgi:hypothetical protein
MEAYESWDPADAESQLSLLASAEPVSPIDLTWMDRM